MIGRWELETETAAARHRLGPRLVAAIVQVESAGNRWAYNPEPHYRWLWDVRRNQPYRQLLPGEAEAERPPLDFPCLAGDRDQEWWAQQASWGLMQTMGAVAREVGFGGSYLTELCDPAVSLEYGCRFLRKLFDKHGALDAVLAAWNTGNIAHPPGSAAEAYIKKVYAQMGGGV